MLNSDARQSATPLPSPARKSAQSFPRANGELILIADDQASVRDLLQIVLKNQGYRTITATDGVEAVATLKAHLSEIAGVVTDLHMPNTGNQPIQVLLRQVSADIPILFISGLAGSAPGGGDGRTGNSRDPFLLKPFRPVALLEAVHRLLHPEALPKT